MAKRKSTKKVLKVVLDSSVIYTQLAHDLFSSAIRELIQTNNSHPDLEITWHLPDVVIEERAFQMKKSAADLLPPIEKLEKLIGHNLAITKEALEEYVETAITKQLSSYKVNVIKLDTSAVDWRRIINSAVRREAPFQVGEKEKGFRDSLILEAFVQLVENSPRTPSICRIVFIAGDGLLGEAAKHRVSQNNNTEVLDNIEDLKNLINTLASQVDEAFVKELQEKAKLLFFKDSEHKDTLYYKEKVAEKIQEQYASQLSAVAGDVDKTELDTIKISSPRFLKKEGQRIYWVTSLTYLYMDFKYETVLAAPNIGIYASPSATGSTLQNITQWPAMPSSALAMSNLLYDLNTSSGAYPVTSTMPSSVYPVTTTMPSLATQTQSVKSFLRSRSVTFEVHWSATVDANKKMTRATISQIDLFDAK